ncbi:MAG TPA: shikimate kinase [Pyrinomonadaceae bacterium]|nr:shikimate kinase [Pyrinomonadaceae bacterium]
MKLVITGFMGSGKTRVARELARRLGLSIVDLDEKITEKERRSPAQLIVEEGEQAFRVIESEVLRELLDTNTAGVIALGGGAWIQETNRSLIHQHRYLSVWLDVPFEVCWARIETSGEDRPLGKTREQAQALYEQRRPIYELANVRIAVGNQNLEDLITLILNKLE